MSSPRPGDMSAGFIGLGVALLFLLATVFAIVEITNRKFEGHGTAAAQSHSPAGAPAGAATDSAAHGTTAGDTTAAAAAPSPAH